MEKAKLVIYIILAAAVVIVWFLLLGGGNSVTNDSTPVLYNEKTPAAGIDSYIDIIIFSSFSPMESEKLSGEVLKYAGRRSAVRILSANHLTASYSGQDPKSLGFYLSTVLTNTEKANLGDVCGLLALSFKDYQNRGDSIATRVFLLGMLPEAVTKDDPALYCISRLTGEMKSSERKSNIEYFTCLHSEDTANPLDKDLIGLLAGSNYNVSIIMIN